MSDSAPSGQPTKRSSSWAGWRLLGLATVAILLFLGVYLYRGGLHERGPNPFAAATPSALPAPVDPDEDPFADLSGPSQPPGNYPSAISRARPNRRAALAEPFFFLSNQPEPELASADMEKVASAEVVAARRKHVADSAAELEKLAVAHRDALAALAEALDAQPDAPPSKWIDLLDAERAAHQARLDLAVELARRIELRQAYTGRLAKLEAELADKTSADKRRGVAALRAAQAEAAFELAREQYRDQLGPAEVAVLEDTAARLQELFDQVEKLFEIGARGGEMERRSRAGYECSRARARLARACGDRPTALAELRRAAEFARDELNARHTRNGEEPLDMNAEAVASRNLAEAMLELIDYALLLGDQQQLDWVRRGGQ